MDRREFLLATGSLLAAAPLSAPTHAAASPAIPQAAARHLTLSVAGLDRAGWIAVQAHLLARNIEQKSPQPLQIKVVDVSAGRAADLRLLTASELVGRDPGFAFATGLPGSRSLDAGAVDAWLSTGGGQPLLDRLAASHGLKVLLAAHSGESFLWSAKPFEKPEDFAGKAVHADGLACHVAAGLGAEPWRILQGSRQAAFEDGSLAAVEQGTTGAISDQVHRHAGFVSSGALAPNGTAAVLTISLQAWQALTMAGRELISAAARTTYLESVRTNRAFEPMNREALARSFGLQIAPVPQALAVSIEAVAGAMIAQAGSSSPAAMSLNASYMSFLVNPLNSNGENRHV